VDESLLTGESFPVQKSEGSPVIAGSVNIESPLQVTVSHVGQDTTLAGIQRLLERAQTEKPRLAQVADRVAGYFIFALLLIAAGAGLYWYVEDPQHALWVVISILVVTCPCALSLATPTALTAATGRLTREGMLTTRGHALETLARVNHIIFDKTGTLTEGKLTLSSVIPMAGQDAQQVLQLAASLEQHSEHPIAKVLLSAVSREKLRVVTDMRNVPGMGIEGEIAQQQYFIGNARFIGQRLVDIGQVVDDSNYRVLLADDRQVIAAFEFEDKLRPQVKETLAQLRDAGIKLSLLSGDRQAEVNRISEQLGIHNAVGELTPDGKLQRLRNCQQQGDVVAMLGDGINDAPVLSQAQVSIAMGEGTQIAHASADMVLLSNDMHHLWISLQVARQMRRVIKQNLAWALIYNLIALPAAAAGWVAPWMAAIGMSSSSLIVVLNALRLTRRVQKADHSALRTVSQVD
jgi:Cu2+-exporting ATPase